MKEHLIKKYKSYIGNLEWDLSNNKRSPEETDTIKSKIWIYQEILNDLENL